MTWKLDMLEVASMVVTWWLFCAVSFMNDSLLTLTVLIATIDVQWEGMGDVGSARYEPALLPACPTVNQLS